MPSCAHAVTESCKESPFCHRVEIQCDVQKKHHVSLRLGWLSRHPATSTDGLKSHSPPRPPQTPAAQFKRPYRNCPDHTISASPHFFFRDSPDRALTSHRTNLQGFMERLNEHMACTRQWRTQWATTDFPISPSNALLRQPDSRNKLSESERPNPFPNTPARPFLPAAMILPGLLRTESAV